MEHHLRQILRLVIASAFGLAAASCAIPADTSATIGEDATVHEARRGLVGLTEAQIRMCAGFPTATVNAGDAGKIWTYQQRNISRGSLNISVPTVGIGSVPGVGGGVNVAPGGSCSTQVRMVDGRVAEVAFSGDNNTPTSLNSLCASMIDECVVYARQLRGKGKRR
ncbi:hypothetical protein ATN84_21975 [Paramesorhizobium deserti]|uniref:Lipoprotein SmpA/OmlA domain-containing protein n=1 Tax=Paramesorhizobium deserti TaxID=1494590 RepID=A0A135HNU7_9HYPH|nr:hypothetical protein [Paramesorhizobium deserti]KXF74892.1 hypothetical protein ATN84_21975 [Paramesorhizobium deserti]